jgi:hypothetical protein
MACISAYQSSDNDYLPQIAFTPNGKSGFIPLFEVVYVYGLSEDLEWEPYYAPRLRGNVMRFK